MIHPIQLLLNQILDYEHPTYSVSAMNYIDCLGERFIQVERKSGHMDAIIPLYENDTEQDIRERVIAHPAYY